MERAALALPLLLLVTAFAGCLTGGDDATLDETSGPTSADAVDPGAGTAADHGAPKREVSAVTTELGQDGRWHARKTVTLTNDFGGATDARVHIGFAAGELRVAPDSNGGYTYLIELDVAAASEAAAKEGLREVELKHADRLQGGTLALSTHVELPQADSPAPGVNLGGRLDRHLSVSFAAHLAPQAGYDMEADTASADIQVADLRGDRVDLSTASGDIRVSGTRTERVEAESASGDITLEDVTAEATTLSGASSDITASGAFGEVDVGTASGEIDVTGKVTAFEAGSASGDITARLTPTRSGAFDIASTSGSVALTLATGATYGYFVSAETVSGDIDVDLPDSERTRDDDDHVHVKTNGLDRREVRVEAEIVTTSGDITVQGA